MHRGANHDDVSRQQLIDVEIGFGENRILFRRALVRRVFP